MISVLQILHYSYCIKDFLWFSHVITMSTEKYLFKCIKSIFIIYRLSTLKVISCKEQKILYLLFYLLFYSWEGFSHQRFSDSKFQVSRSLPSILANLNNAVVWMAFTCPLISIFSSLFTNNLVGLFQVHQF